jgi:hypothetical protein
MAQVGIGADTVGVGDLDGVDRTVGADGNGGSTEERSGGSTEGVSLNDMNGGKNAGSVVTEPSGEKQKSPRIRNTLARRATPGGF